MKFENNFIPYNKRLISHKKTYYKKNKNFIHFN